MVNPTFHPVLLIYRYLNEAVPAASIFHDAYSECIHYILSYFQIHHGIRTARTYISC